MKEYEYVKLHAESRRAIAEETATLIMRQIWIAVVVGAIFYHVDGFVKAHTEWPGAVELGLIFTGFVAYVIWAGRRDKRKKAD